MDSQSSSSMANYSHPYSESNISRRSVDWRDSGIVIDEDYQFNSIEAICNFNSTQNSQCNRTSGCCPLERVVLEQDDDGDTILHLAVVGCTLDKVRDLIKICDLDAINNMMQTPLHVATLANRPEMVELLLESGANLNVHDRRGNTPLHLACQKGHKDIAMIILEAILKSHGNNVAATNSPLATIGQHLETTNFDGQTCLHLAAVHNKRDIIELLVHRYDSNLNCRDSRSGETIMHKAITSFQVDLVAFILSLNSRQHCNQADYCGRKPSDTINILCESKIDAEQAEKLRQMDKLINDRIKICIEQAGCCAMPIDCDNEIIANGQMGTQAIIVDSSSSDYSDSDSDMG